MSHLSWLWELHTNCYTINITPQGKLPPFDKGCICSSLGCALKIFNNGFLINLSTIPPNYIDQYYVQQLNLGRVLHWIKEWKDYSILQIVHSEKFSW